MTEHLGSSEQPAPSPDCLFRQHLNIAFDAAAEIRARLHALNRDDRPKTSQQVEDMAQVAKRLQQIADSLGI